MFLITILCKLLHGNAFARHEGPVEYAEPLHHGLFVRYLHSAATDLAKLSGEELPAGRSSVVQLVVDDAGGHLEGGQCWVNSSNMGIVTHFLTKKGFWYSYLIGVPSIIKSKIQSHNGRQFIRRSAILQFLTHCSPYLA